MTLENHSGFTLLGDIVPNGFKIGDANTYIFIDTSTKKIEFWVDGVKVHEFS